MWSMAIIAAAVALAQVPTEFDVASIRPNTLDDRIVTIDVGPGGRFVARGYTLKLLIQRAYGVLGFEISGGPRWLDTDRYDVAAKAIVPGNLTEEQLKPMLRQLLAERFKLKVHEGSKEMSAFVLSVAPDGHKMKVSTNPAEQRDSFRMGNTGISAQAISMANVARYIGGKLGLVMVDKTGLTGFYDLKADWMADTEVTPGTDARDALRPIVFKALQDQLGLKVTSQRTMLPILIVDSAEKASAN